MWGGSSLHKPQFYLHLPAAALACALARCMKDEDIRRAKIRGLGSQNAGCGDAVCGESRSCATSAAVGGQGLLLY